MKKFNLVFWILLFYASLAKTQYRWETPPKDSLGVRLGITSPILFSDIKDSKPSGAGTPIKYEPNSGSRTALTLFYSHFALTGSVPNKLSAQDKTEKGDSRIEDYQFRFYYKYGTWDFFYQNYEGYYIKNSQEVDPSFSSGQKILRPDIKTSHAGIQYFYIPNPENYSLGGTFDQNIRQTESGGSVFFSSYLGQHSVTADNPLVPSRLAAGYGTFANFKEGYFQNIRIGVGYGYTAVLLNQFYLGVVFGISHGLQQQKFDLITEKFDRWVTSNGTNVRVGLGYNGKRFFSGVQFIMDNTAIGFNEYTLGVTSGEYKIFVGTRFEGINIPPIQALGEWLYGD